MRPKAASTMPLATFTTAGNLPTLRKRVRKNCEA